MNTTHRHSHSHRPAGGSVARIPSPLRKFLIGLAALISPGVAGTMLFDFGDPGSTSGGVSGPTVVWNDITTAVATADFTEVYDLQSTDGTYTPVGLRIESRFTGANENGTPASGIYPTTATQDSLYGNTELFGGLENVTPRFQLIGLTPGAAYDLTFYASRMGVGDNRETRYTVTGVNEGFTDLDVANNVSTTVSVNGITANGLGEITVALTPGPNNNNANHFTYLGALEVRRVGDAAMHLLLDFGSGTYPTGTVEPTPGIHWNNVVTSLGQDPSGVLNGLVTTNGDASTYTFQMVSRFNGANTAGTTASTLFPATATRDSLYGNTEVFGGLSNITPEFKLTGLSSGLLYRFTFHASRTGASDNRETRYVVAGGNSGSADLNASNNVDETAVVEGIRPDEAGEITVRLEPGPNNNNANHFTYLNVLQLDWAPVPKPTVLIDFGAAASATQFGVGDPENYWNNVDATLGANPEGTIEDLQTAAGGSSGFGFRMVSRFNGANTSGTTAPGPFAAPAIQDSLFGNTEPFSGLENVTPVFQLTGLTPGLPYDLTFYASRMGVSDNRETRYLVEGATTAQADLNAGNNETETVTVSGIRPDAEGRITVRLEPGPNNDNANHFTYLGVLRIDWTPAAEIRLSAPQKVGDRFRFTVSGESGRTYSVQASGDLVDWVGVGSITLSGGTGVFESGLSGDAKVFRVIP